MSELATNDHDTASNDHGTDHAGLNDAGQSNQPHQPVSTEGRAVPHFYLTEFTKADGALFPIPSEERSENGPVATGQLNIGEKAYRLAAFRAIGKESDTPYFQMRLEDGEQGANYTGRAFKAREPKPSVTSPDLSGFLTVLPIYDGRKYDTETWDAAPQLLITLHNERARTTGKAYYRVSVFPESVQPGELPL